MALTPEVGVKRYEVWLDNKEGAWALHFTTDTLQDAYDAIMAVGDEGGDAYIYDRKEGRVVANILGAIK